MSKNFSAIQSLIGHWRNTDNYQVIYTDDDVIFVDILIHGTQYSFGIVYQIYKHLDGSDEIILHKNLMDFCAIYKFLCDQTNYDFHEYLKEMFMHPYDFVSIEQALLEAKKAGVFKFIETT